MLPERIRRKHKALTKIEIGVIKTPSVVIMAKIAKALDVNIEGLFQITYEI